MIRLLVPKRSGWEKPSIGVNQDYKPKEEAKSKTTITAKPERVKVSLHYSRTIENSTFLERQAL